jgi:hypothetical protein
MPQAAATAIAMTTMTDLTLRLLGVRTEKSPSEALMALSLGFVGLSGGTFDE